ncbi:MAG: hypothetical protein NTX50_10955 [Candidatus Sumerlaeota bacterium]|nr:hypothetical protein [Candidatus Sumerlaeota bacterium]
MTLETYLKERESRYDPELRLFGGPLKSPGYHTRLTGDIRIHSTRESLDYAHALLMSANPKYQARACEVIAKVLSLQDTDPASKTYGIWSWFYEEPLAKMSPPDWNWADFCGARLASMLAGFPERLPAELQTQMRAALGHAARAIERRNVGPGYTNIAIMGGGVTLMAGEMLKEPGLLDYGRRRLRAMVDFTKQQGDFNEYNSPTYTMVALHEVERILAIVRDPQAREDAEWLRRHAWTVIADHFHPGAGQWAGPHSRAYSDWLTTDTARRLARQTSATLIVRGNGGETISIPPNDFAGPEYVAPLPCPGDLAPRFLALPKGTLPDGSSEIRRCFIKNKDDALTIWGTTWLSQEACLGSVNRDCFWTQRRPLIGYWKTDADAAVCLKLRFLHDGRDFSSAILRNDQKGARILTAIGTQPGGGDFHITLDRPKDGIFTAKDFRLRYQLAGRGVSAVRLSDNRFALVAGGWRAVIHVLPGAFDGKPAPWELGSAGRDPRDSRDRRDLKESGDDAKTAKNPDDSGDIVFLDAVCYQGPERSFDFRSLGETYLAAGLELIGRDAPPSAESPRLTHPAPERVAVDWTGAAPLSVEIAARTK